MTQIELRGVQKFFGAVQVIKDLNLAINDNEFIVLLGQSGCGKTTTLRAIAGLETIDQGDILIDGKPVQHLKAADRDPEYEESAQSELADFTLSRMIENARRELTQIDAALTRMDENDYGICVDCGQPIPLERLEALPYAIRCEEDASRKEFEARGSHFAAPTL